MIERTTRLAEARPPEATFWLALCEVREDSTNRPSPRSLRSSSRWASRCLTQLSTWASCCIGWAGRKRLALPVRRQPHRWQLSVHHLANGCLDHRLRWGQRPGLRALQPAQGNRGLGMWQNEPDRAWVEGFPEGRSYVRRLATRYRFVCPLLGSDLNIILRPGQFALAQAFIVRDAFRRPSTSTPSCWRTRRPRSCCFAATGCRWLGSGSTTRLTSTFASHWSKRSPRTRSPRPTWLSAAALGKPTNVDDKPRNIIWSLSPDRPLPGDGKRRVGGLIASIHAEARKIGVPTGVEEQQLLCDSLASVKATDPPAALAYSHLAATSPTPSVPSTPGCTHAPPRSTASPGRATCTCSRALFRTGIGSLVFRAAKVGSRRSRIHLPRTLRPVRSRSVSRSPGIGVSGPRRVVPVDSLREREAAGHKELGAESAEVLLKLAPTSWRPTIGWPVCTTVKGRWTGPSDSSRLAPVGAGGSLAAGQAGDHRTGTGRRPSPSEAIDRACD